MTIIEIKDHAIKQRDRTIRSLQQELATLREALEQFKTHSETNAVLYERALVDVRSRDARARQCVEYLGVPITNPSGEPFDELSQSLQAMPTWSEVTALREEAKRLRDVLESSLIEHEAIHHVMILNPIMRGIKPAAIIGLISKALADPLCSKLIGT